MNKIFYRRDTKSSERIHIHTYAVRKVCCRRTSRRFNIHEMKCCVRRVQFSVQFVLRTRSFLSFWLSCFCCFFTFLCSNINGSLSFNIVFHLIRILLLSLNSQHSFHCVANAFWFETSFRTHFVREPTAEANQELNRCCKPNKQLLLIQINVDVVVFMVSILTVTVVRELLNRN